MNQIGSENVNPNTIRAGTQTARNLKSNTYKAINSDEQFSNSEAKSARMNYIASPNRIMNGFSSIPNLESTKFSSKTIGTIKGYAANTNKGLVRDYNEDRVSIILNIIKSKTGNQDYKASFFGVFDGHGGDTCSDFLRDSLHQAVIKNDNFPSNPKLALREGFLQSEKLFLERAKKFSDHSGSCAIVALIVGFYKIKKMITVILLTAEILEQS